MIIDSAELFANDLVAKLELHRGCKYVLLFAVGSVSKSTLTQAQAAMHKHWGVDTLAFMVDGKPIDCVRGIEVIDRKSES